jgi:hypothetical protein
MHIHHNPIALGSADIHSASAEKAAAAQRAADTRRKLLRDPAQIDGSLDVGQLFMVDARSERHPGWHRQQPPHPRQDGRAAEESSARCRFPSGLETEVRGPQMALLSDPKAERIL